MLTSCMVCGVACQVENHLYQLTIPVFHHVFSAYGTVRTNPNTNMPTTALLAQHRNDTATRGCSWLCMYVFAAFFKVQKVALFEKKGGFQALIQMASVEDAQKAKQALDGHMVYEGCCQLRMSFSSHTNLNVRRNTDTTWDYTDGAMNQGATDPSAAVSPAPGQPLSAGDETRPVAPTALVYSEARGVALVTCVCVWFLVVVLQGSRLKCLRNRRERCLQHTNKIPGACNPMQGNPPHAFHNTQSERAFMGVRPRRGAL